MDNYISVRGARQHNLKNISVNIPKNKLVVFTGVSGSGKSSLAFDTIYAEGQRRYVESLSTYARQFLGIMEKPDVDSIEGLSPAISIDQKTTSHNPRSTVGTVTEIYDYLRLLYARVGHPHCPICGREIASQSIDQIVEGVIKLVSEENDRKVGRYLILSPLAKEKKGEFAELFENLKAKGFTKARIDGQVKDLSEDFLLIKTNKHTIECIIDRIAIEQKLLSDSVYLQNLKGRLSDSIEQALKLSDGLVLVSRVLDPGFEIPERPKKMEDHLFSEKFACPIDNIQISEIEPRMFSFNSPIGACPTCSGIGRILKADPELIIAPEISILEGGLKPFSSSFEQNTWLARIILAVCEANEIDPRAPIKTLPKEKLNILLYGSGDREYEVSGTNRFGRPTTIWRTWLGVAPDLERRHMETTSDFIRTEIERYMRERICPGCSGARLKREALAVTIEKKSIVEISSLSITNCLSWIENLASINSPLSEREKEIATLIIKEIAERLNFLKSVGLEYLTIARSAGTLAGGEAQRIRLASQIGSGLTGVLYVLDEPTIGLHPRDNKKLIDTLKRLRDLGNSVLVVEHDKEMMFESDYIFDFGPGAGKNGGLVIAEGTPSQISNDPKSITGKYLSGKRRVEVGSIQGNLVPKNKSLRLLGCRQFNLKNISVDFPLGKLVVITGVSGSGKSTLLVETLYHALALQLNPLHKEIPGAFSRIEGLEEVDKVILIDQSPIGRTPRSNPATYTGLFDPIREVFSQTKEARVRGYKAGRFSFNVKGGRCEACEGQGQIKIEMQFMSDIWVTCEVCKGKRYNSQTLEVLLKGKNIAEILSMNVVEAIEFFHAYPKIISRLETLAAVGLDYMELGQPATTLSGGEAQRVKLASELSRRETGKTVYILDEPTTGLHFADLERLLGVLKILVAKGNSVFVIEHNMEVIKNADWVIDLGPEGGEKGGRVVAEGTPKEIAANKESYTGHFLAQERG